jgi:hypothetical protein
MSKAPSKVNVRNVPEARPSPGLPWTVALGVLGLLAVSLLWWPVLRITAQDSNNYNEGWNAYIQQAAANGGKIYGDTPRLFYHNYPPVSFYAIGLLSKVTRDVNLTGRWVSLLSLLAIAILSAMIVERLAGSRRAGVYCGLAILVYITLLKPDRVGMNDPHLFAMALGMGGVYCALRDPGSAAWLRASGGLFALSLFSKQTLLAFPLAIAIFLFRSHRKGLVAWLSAAAGASAALLVFTFAAGGSHFLEHLALPRTYSLTNMGVEVSWYVLMCNTAMMAVAVWGFAQRKSAGSGLALWMFVLSTVSGCVYVSGAGGEANLLFDSVVALCICLGLIAAQLPEWAEKTERPNGFMTAALLAPFLAAIYPALVASSGSFELHHSQPRRSEEFQQLVRFVRAQPGPALCETPLVCFEAGKEQVYDPYVVTNLIETGKLRQADVAALFDRRNFGVIQLGRPQEGAPVPITGHDRFSPELVQHIFANYREAFGVSWYGAFVPR